MKLHIKNYLTILIKIVSCIFTIYQPAASMQTLRIDSRIRLLPYHQSYTTTINHQNKRINHTSILDNPRVYKLPSLYLLHKKLYDVIKNDHFLEKSGLLFLLSDKEVSELGIRLALDLSISDYYRSYPNLNMYQILLTHKESMVTCLLNPSESRTVWDNLPSPKESFLDYWGKASFEVKKALSHYFSEVEPRYRLGHLLNGSEVIDGVSLNKLLSNTTSIIHSTLPLSKLSGLENIYFRIVLSNFDFNENIRLIIANDWGATNQMVHFRIRGGDHITFTTRDLFLPQARDIPDDLILQETLIDGSLMKKQDKKESRGSIIKLYINPYNPPLIEILPNCRGKIYVRNVFESEIKPNANLFPYIDHKDTKLIYE